MNLLREVAEKVNKDPLISIFNADAREVLSGLTEGSIDMLVTSPPYFHQRRYPPQADINWSEGGRYQFGAEKSPEQYIDHSLEFFDLFKRILKRTGSVWYNLCDSRDKKGQLLMIPQRLALALQSKGWLLVNYIIWHRGNPTPESVTRRMTDSYEVVLFLAKTKDYFYDIESVRQPFAPSTYERLRYPVGVVPGSKVYEQINEGQGHPPQGENLRHILEQSGANLWDLFCFPADSRIKFSKNHYSVFPLELPRRAILAGCPPYVCSSCGRPHKRIIEKSRVNVWDKKCDRLIEALKPMAPLGETSMFRTGKQLVTRTVGWVPTCVCSVSNEPGVILDPFCGTGTSGAAAKLLGRRAILIDVVPTFCEASKCNIMSITAPFEPVTREWEPEPEKEIEGTQLALFGYQSISTK